MYFSLTTFNLENLGIRPGEDSPEARRRLPAHMETLKGVIENLNTDIICFQEVIDTDLLRQLTAGMGFTYAEFSRPPKNPLCMAVMSKFPIRRARNVVERANIAVRDIDADFNASISADFSRPVFEVEIELPGNTLLLHTVHWKSKIPSALSSGAGQTWPWANFHEVAQGRLISEVTRMAQALCLRKILDAEIAAKPDGLFAVLGDFNDTAESEAIRMITGDSRAVRNQELASLELWPCEASLPPEKCYTMLYRGSKQMLDHIFVSRKLKEKFVSGNINHEGMKPARDGSWLDQRPGSDHAPFTVTFNI